MIISRNSQLGLMMDDENLQVEFLQLRLADTKHTIDILDRGIEKAEQFGEMFVDEGGQLSQQINNGQIDSRIGLRFADSGDSNNFIDNKNSKLYLICDGVDKCSKMIRIGDNFSSKALSNIEFGKHTYLMGKDEVCRFLCIQGAIKGIYWCRSKKIAFEFGFDLQDDGYYFHSSYPDEFNKIAKIITFVYLGDIEVTMIEKGKNNGKTKKAGKVTNGTDYTVYVVDSSWNKLIIRTEGFAVMGHFRLQPCGKDFSERKLIWIDAFEKHGYKRQPRGKIINE